MATYHHEGKESSIDSEKPVQRGDAAFILDERRRAALAEVDNAKFSYAVLHSFSVCQQLTFFLSSWFHAKVCLVAGVGFFTDAYVSSPSLF